MKFSGLLAGALMASMSGASLETPYRRTEPQPLPPGEKLPDRVCIDKTSKFFDGRYKRMGVRFDGKDRNSDVQEYCVSEGWIRVRERNDQKRFIIQSDGSYKITQLFGVVEPYWKRENRAVMKGPSVVVEHDSAGALARAEAKNKRKAEKNARLAMQYGKREN